MTKELNLIAFSTRITRLQYWLFAFILCSFGSLLNLIAWLLLGENSSPLNEVVGNEALNTFEIIDIVLSLLYFVVFIGCAVYTIKAFREANRKVSELHGGGLKYSPRDCLSCFFIPIINLYKPYNIALEFVTKSFAEPDEKAAKKLVGTWWCLFIVMGSFNTLGYRLITASQSGSFPYSRETAEILLILHSVADLILSAFAAYFLIRMLSLVLENLVHGITPEEAAAKALDEKARSRRSDGRSAVDELIFPRNNPSPVTESTFMPHRPQLADSKRELSAQTDSHKQAATSSRIAPLLSLVLVSFVLLIAGILYALYAKPAPPLDPLYSKPYVIIYGRKRCGYTVRTLNELKNSALQYYYEPIDNRQTAALLHERMKLAGHSTRRYGLPVVDVNGIILIRPSFSAIEAAYYKPYN